MDFCKSQINFVITSAKLENNDRRKPPHSNYVGVMWGGNLFYMNNLSISL